MESTKKFSKFQYFDSKEFSPRYGDHIFTVKFEHLPESQRSLETSNTLLDKLAAATGVTVGGGCCVPQKYVVYVVTVCRGKYTWTVKKRYSQFAELKALMTHGVHGGRELHDIVKDVDMPPTTLFDVSGDPVFLDERQEGLAEFLITVLGRISAKHLVTDDVLGFLGIDDEDPDAPGSIAQRGDL